MPRDFVFFDPDIRVWIPRLVAPLERSDNQRHAVTDVHVGRLKPDATMEQAQSQVTLSTSLIWTASPSSGAFLLMPDSEPVFGGFLMY